MLSKVIGDLQRGAATGASQQDNANKKAKHWLWLHSDFLLPRNCSFLIFLDIMCSSVNRVALSHAPRFLSNYPILYYFATRNLRCPRFGSRLTSNACDNGVNCSAVGWRPFFVYTTAKIAAPLRWIPFFSLGFHYKSAKICGPCKITLLSPLPNYKKFSANAIDNTWYFFVVWWCVFHFLSIGV